MKKILLIDANLLLFRSFYAAQAISKTPGNMPTHLFFLSFLEIFKEEKPNYVFFAFDAYGETKRHQEFSEYKAGRIKAPQELYDQKKVIIEILNKMNLSNLAKVGDEADDLIATICEKYKNENEIIILSEDKDLLQLIDQNVFIAQKNRDKKINAKYIKISNNNFFEKFNFYPNQVTDFKGIAGDSSDNLSGIKGIGPKTTIELLSKYKTLEGIYENLNSLTEKQKNAFLENKDHAFMCKKLATLNKFVEEEFNLENMKVLIENINSLEVKMLLEKYNLKRILNIIENL